VPTVSTFNDPTARFTAHAPQQRGFASASNMRDDASRSSFSFGFVVVVSLVEAEVNGPTHPTTAAQCNSIESLSDHPLVMNVGPCDLHRERHASRVGQHVAFDALFGSVGRIRAG